MPEGRRNRRYSSYKDKSKQQNSDNIIHPKILLKTKEKDIQVGSSESATQNASSSTKEPQVTVVTSTVSSSTTSTSTQISLDSSQSSQPVPQMVKPITILSLVNNQVHANTIKVLMKANTDFLVVGVIGRQGIGKSTIMNLLASPRSGLDFSDNQDSLAANVEEIYNKFFRNREGIFPTRFKPGKGPSTPRTESLHMFITKDRVILLDGPPVLSNPGKKDAATNEIEDINLIILLLTVCHLVIVVQDDYFDINLIRLIQFAELCKPTDTDLKPFKSNHLPNVLFVKNHAKDKDFLVENRMKYEKWIRYCFKDSNLKIFFGQTDHRKKSKNTDNEKVNYLMFPEISEHDLHSSNLDIFMDELRQRVFMNPRNSLLDYECNEVLWFELFSNNCMNKNEFYLSKYEEIRRNHTNSHNESS